MIIFIFIHILSNCQLVRWLDDVPQTNLQLGLFVLGRPVQEENTTDLVPPGASSCLTGVMNWGFSWIITTTSQLVTNISHWQYSRIISMDCPYPLVNVYIAIENGH